MNFMIINYKKKHGKKFLEMGVCRETVTTGYFVLGTSNRKNDNRD
jgi:hypothetical protein